MGDPVGDARWLGLREHARESNRVVLDLHVESDNEYVEPDNEYDSDAVAVWNDDRTLQAGYIPRELAPQLQGTELAVSLWRGGEGLRVLIVPAGSWVGRPRR